MDIREVLTAAGYPAVERITGVEQIRNLPCPVVEHKNQGLHHGPAMIYPPTSDDRGTITCRNCNQNWGARKLADELGVTNEVLAGRERYIPPRQAAKPEKEKQPVEPIDMSDTWVKCQATTVHSRNAFQYFKRRWRNDDCAEEALQFVGWSSGLKTDYWKKYPHHLLLVPLRDKNGSVVSGVRRFTGHGKAGIKSIRISNEAVSLASGTPVWFGDPPPAAAKYAAGSTLYIAEGEVDTLLLMALRENNRIEGGILGAAGGAASTPKWWDETAKLIAEPPTSVVIVMDADAAGDKYWQKSATAFPNAQRAFLPDGNDLTDTMTKFGIEEVLSLLAASRSAHFRFYQLDNGQFAYLSGDNWYTGTGRNSLTARLRSAGYDYDEAKSMATNLPPARDVAFDPSSTEPVVVRRSNVWLNQFRGLPLKAEPGDCSLYTGLLHWLCNEDSESFEFCMDWIAKPLQSLYTGRGAYRNKSALIFYGEQGSGKGFFWGPDGMMRAIYGCRQTEILQTQMDDSFDHKSMTTVLMLIANEVACSGYRDSKTLNRLKAWITEPTIQVRRMRRTAEEMPIWFNMVFMSNDDTPIRLEPGDRRYSVFSQNNKLDPSMIKSLVKERDMNWPGAVHFLDVLLRRSIVTDLAVPLENTARMTLLDASKPSQVTFAELIADFGLNAVMKDWVEAVGEKRAGPFTDADSGFVSGEHLMETYRFWCRQTGINYPVRMTTLYRAIKLVIPDMKKTQGRLGNRRVRGLMNLPMGSGGDRVKAVKQTNPFVDAVK